MKTVLNFLKSDNGLLLIIVLIGAILRFYDAFNIPFTHDELSAYYRLQFESFSELIEKGVKVDGHPALIQVFLFYWIKLFGDNELTVKLPFLLMGIGAIPLSYSITKIWFNSSTALIVAVFIATLQFPIMFSQIARPYISGLFFSLLLVKYWTQFLFEKRTNSLPFIGMVLSAALCSYNHYFSLMFAGIVGLTGLFFINKTNAKIYVISLLAVIILFLPHLQIFLFQFSGKGLDWLSVPDSSFIIEHIKFIFHFSPWVYLLVISIFVIGIYQRKTVAINKFQVIALAWFLIPIIIGVTYSVLVKPVVQYSMLIFSFPFLLIFLFSFIKPLKFPVKGISLIVIILINVNTLIYSRAHYHVFYKQPFERYSSITKEFKDNHTESKLEIFLDGNPKYVNFYFEKLNPELHYQSVFKQKISPIDFRHQLEKSDSDYLLLGNIPKNLVWVAKEKFPYVTYRENGVNYSFYILSKVRGENKNIFSENIYFSDKAEFETLSLDTTQEWSPAIELNLNDIIKSRHTVVEIELDFLTHTMNNGLIVCSVSKGDSVLIWRAISLDEYTNSALFGQFQKGYLAVSLTSAFNSNRDIEGAKLKVLYWNNNKQNITLKDLKVQITAGNKYEYATIEAID